MPDVTFVKQDEPSLFSAPHVKETVRTTEGGNSRALPPFVLKGMQRSLRTIIAFYGSRRYPFRRLRSTLRFCTVGRKYSPLSAPPAVLSRTGCTIPVCPDC